MLMNKPQKGMIDDFPGDMKKYNFIKSKIDEVARLFSYAEYDAPVLEPVELYASKSSDELVKEQSYLFTDRGGRNLMLRPEMTPSLARMVSQIIKEKPKPFKWYACPKCYRYERPQKGRLREFRQLNFDCIGDSTVYADFEMLQTVISVLNTFKVPRHTYEIRYNHRGLMQEICLAAGMPATALGALFQLVDKKNKIPPDDFQSALSGLCGNNTAQINALLSARSPSDVRSLIPNQQNTRLDETIKKFFEFTELLGSTECAQNTVFSPETVRGLDYYTGLVFEVYDTRGSIGRALFGGGRYDNLISHFSSESVSGIGFGMGIYIFSIFLEELNVMPSFKDGPDTEAVFIIPVAIQNTAFCFTAAEKLRKNAIPAEVSAQILPLKKQFTKATQRGFTYAAVIGDTEMQSGQIKIKNLTDGSEVMRKLT